jgi:hypothetical protein
MNKVIIGLVALAVIGGGVWWFTKNKAALPGVTPGQQAAEEFSGTLAQAMKLGVPMKCEWTSPDGSGESYVKGEDVYAKTQAEGKTGFMLKKGDCVYTWSEAEKQGVKFCQLALPSPTAAPEADNEGQPGGNYQAQGVDMNVQYKCRPDIFSGDKFELPSDVQFLDMESALKNMMLPNPALPSE